MLILLSLILFINSSPSRTFSTASSSSSTSTPPPRPSPSHKSFLRSYSDSSSQCRKFISYSQKKLLFYDARRELNLPVYLPHRSLVDRASSSSHDMMTQDPADVHHQRRSLHQHQKNSTSSSSSSSSSSPSSSSPDCTSGGDGYLSASYGGLSFPLNHSIITYARVYKCNSENIAYSLLKASHLNLTSISFTSLNKALGSPTFQSFYNSFQEKYHQSLSNIHIFAFFRHPFEHFFSGLTESHFRHECGLHNTDITSSMAQECLKKLNSTNYTESKGHHHQNNLKIVTNSIIKSIFESILSCETNATKKYLSTITHFSPQTTTLHEWKPHFIGYLENFTTYWHELEEFMNRTVPYIPYYQHVTQDDPFQIKSHLVHLLHQNISYHRALCRLLMSDFICFGYSLPMECHDMRDERGNYIPYGSTATVKKVEKGGKEKESKMV